MTKPFQLNLGTTICDKITGFEGVITGRVEYLTGCVQYLLTPKIAEDGSHRNGEWFDEGRLVDCDAPAGPDMQPPTK